MTIDDNIQLFLCCLIIVLENKGGSGKSTIAQICVETLKMDGSHVHVIETDTSNSTMTAAQLSTGDVISTRSDGFIGGFLEAIELIEMGAAQHCVVDCGARDEADIMMIIPDLAQKMREIGGFLIVVRPISTNHFVQNNAVSCADQLIGSDARVIFASNISCGRRAEDFKRWTSTKSFARLTEAGVVSIDIGNAGAVLADNATSFGLSFADVALARFDRAGRFETIARQLFDRRLQLATAEWLAKSTKSMRQAIETCCKRGWK